MVRSQLWTDLKSHQELRKMVEPQASSLEMITTLIDFFKTRSEVQIAMLYGSFAKNKQTDLSDVDVGVFLASKMTLDDRIEIHTSLSNLTNRKVDLIDLRTVHGTILKQALQGKRLKVVDTNVLANLIKRSLLDDADFGPLRSRILKTRRDAYFGSYLGKN
jgi:uncharacterized protein